MEMRKAIIPRALFPQNSQTLEHTLTKPQLASQLISLKEEQGLKEKGNT